MKIQPGLKTLVLFLTFASASFAFEAPSAADIARWQKQAQGITVIRDDWGIAHVYGKTDADAVFGMEYTQAEDDFNRVETNYLNSLGRLAEAEGESKVYQDLRQRLFIDPAQLKKEYSESPAWLQTLMNSFADGLNFYLYKHPEVHPRVITRFEPWMALSFSEGSIGGDIERIKLDALQAFYGHGPVSAPASVRASAAAPTVAPGAKVLASRFLRSRDEAESNGEYVDPGGSNGAAVGPSNTATHHSLLLINPHTSFYFRSELQMVSDEGLNAYGAATWGQFFLYQGFNEKVGWMHTSSGVDAVDEFLETVTRKGDQFVYKYGREERPVTSSEITVRYKAAQGMAEKKFTAYRTHHGPIIRSADGKWVAFAIMVEHIKALEQSYLRTKAHDYKSYRETMELKGNSSNNTIFADADGDIAYFHGNYIPRRNSKYDYTKPVDGSDPETDWHGLLSVDETPHLLNPKSGWLYNVNNWPWSAAGPDSPKRENYPAYVEMHGESARGLHAIRILKDKKDFTLDSFIAAAFDSYLPWFEKPMPALLKAYDAAPASNPLKAPLADQIKLLRSWDYRWGVSSVPTSLAVFWGSDISKKVTAAAKAADMSAEDYIGTKATPDQLLKSLADASAKLQSDFGSWNTAWGAINRFQRVNDDISPSFDDSQPSIPVEFTSSQWGSLASFSAKAYPNTKKWYGSSGNSFVAVVEFGPKVRAKAVTAGGESGKIGTKHFNDEAVRYSTGQLRDVYYYRDQLKGHTEREYHPGS